MKYDDLSGIHYYNMLNYIKPEVRRYLKFYCGEGNDAQLLRWFKEDKSIHFDLSSIQLKTIRKILEKRLSWKSIRLFKYLFFKCSTKGLDYRDCKTILQTYSEVIKRKQDNKVKIEINGNQIILNKEG
jgi:hypothetical protein